MTNLLNKFTVAAAGAVLSFIAIEANAVQAATFVPEFPAGKISFADEVVSYDNNGGPTAPHSQRNNALGKPNYDRKDFYRKNDCTPEPTKCSFVSLGDGGSIVLEFTDNFLTGSGDTLDDLWIFEVGPDVEDTFVEISKDRLDWKSIGKVSGSTRGIDIDSFGFGITDLFSFVRLTDDPNEGRNSGDTVGADIDAVGAISSVPKSVPTSVPEPSTALGLGIFGIGVLLKKKLTSCCKA